MGMIGAEMAHSDRTNKSKTLLSLVLFSMLIGMYFI
jgi:hypothetical protein